MSLEQEMAEDAKTIKRVTAWQTLRSASSYTVIAEVAMERVGTMTLLKNVKNGTKMLKPPTTIKEGFKYIGKGLNEVRTRNKSGGRFRIWNNSCTELW